MHIKIIHFTSLFEKKTTNIFSTMHWSDVAVLLCACLRLLRIQMKSRKCIEAFFKNLINTEAPRGVQCTTYMIKNKIVKQINFYLMTMTKNQFFSLYFYLALEQMCWPKCVKKPEYPEKNHESKFIVYNPWLGESPKCKELSLPF